MLIYANNVYYVSKYKFLNLKVKYWITINEPYVISESYGNESGAPALSKSGFGDYLAIHHTILAHATAYNLYNREFRAIQNG